MAKFKDLTGQQFGRLKVIRRTRRSNGKSKHSIWECVCDCGKIKEVVSTSLTRNLTKSCGCYFLETAGQNQIRLNACEASFNLLLHNYKKGAKRRNLEWSLSNDQFKSLTKGYCYYCNIKPEQFIKRNDLNGGYIHNGIDRLDNNLGYNTINCVPCCGMCNWIKGKYNHDIFIKHILKIAINWSSEK